MTQKALLATRTANQRTAIELLILLGYASMVCLFLVRLFVSGRLS